MRNMTVYKLYSSMDMGQRLVCLVNEEFSDHVDAIAVPNHDRKSLQMADYAMAVEPNRKLIFIDNDLALKAIADGYGKIANARMRKDRFQDRRVVDITDTPKKKLALFLLKHSDQILYI